MCGGDMDDGGSIYTLGPQLGSSLHDNYLHHQCDHYGLLYHDSGSKGFDDYNNVLANNNNNWWLLINGDGYNDTVHNNFVDASCNTTYAACRKGKTTAQPASTGNGTCKVWGITFVQSAAQFPPQARAIIANAGLKN